MFWLAVGVASVLAFSAASLFHPDVSAPLLPWSLRSAASLQRGGMWTNVDAPSG